MSRQLVVALLVAGVSVVAVHSCSSDHTLSVPSGVDAAVVVVPDASTNQDDAGSVEDAGETVDAGEVVDAGETIDAGPVDAGHVEIPKDQLLRFVAIGDQGKGNDKQYNVGTAIATVCAQRGGCHFGITLGDNFYPSGVSSVTDQQWQDKFEKPYAPTNFQFYAVLGNHDYGNEGKGVDTSRAQVEVDYSNHSSKWKMPAPHYSFVEGSVDFFAFDTHAFFVEDLTPSLGFPLGDLTKLKNRAQEQRDAFPARLAASTKKWKIALGHHPYLSNGPHGNAGNYEGLPSAIPGAGKGVKKFIEDHLCGKVDVYLAGHDHSIQDFGETCGTQFIVSGGGSSTSELGGRNNAVFESLKSGFLLIEATPNDLQIMFFDETAQLLHRRTVVK